MDDPDKALLQAKLNLDTSLIGWHELQRHFAAGKVVAVRAHLDLIEAAIGISTNDTQQVEAWLCAGVIGKVTDEEARIWFDSKASLWAVVVKPWVLVQASKPGQLQ